MKDEKMKFIDYLLVGVMFLIAMAAASCTYERNQPCTKGEPVEGVVCAEIYKPVIAPDGTEYPNSCYAEKDGWDNYCLLILEL